jgi:hypothetical protein
MTNFKQNASGQYEFNVKGVAYEAIRNEAGFAGRDWDLYTSAAYGDGRIVVDQLASRKECVEAAEQREAATVWHWSTDCGSGWTGDRCTFPLLHSGDHSND